MIGDKLLITIFHTNNANISNNVGIDDTKTTKFFINLTILQTFYRISQMYVSCQ